MNHGVRVNVLSSDFINTATNTKVQPTPSDDMELSQGKKINEPAIRRVREDVKVMFGAKPGFEQAVDWYGIVKELIRKLQGYLKLME